MLILVTSNKATIRTRVIKVGRRCWTATI